MPTELAAWVAAAPAAMDATRTADEWDGPTRQRVLAALDHVLDVVTVGKARVVSAEREAGTWALRGDRDLAGFLGRTSRQGRGGGAAQVAQAETLSAMPAVADALVEGAMTVRHVEQIARASAASPTLAAELVSSEGQTTAVELARRLDGQEFGRALARMSAALDPAARQREHDEQRASRSLVVTRTRGGTLLRGRLDAVAGHELQKMLDAHSPRPAKDDERSREQRQADALVAMVRRLASDRTTMPGSTAPVQVLVTMPADTWAALRRARDDADRGASGSTGSAGDLVDVLRGVPPVVDERGTAWPASEIGRALCDCRLTRAVVDGAGLPLDLGRGERLFSVSTGWRCTPPVSARVRSRGVACHWRSPSYTTPRGGSAAVGPTWPTWRRSARSPPPRDPSARHPCQPSSRRVLRAPPSRRAPLRRGATRDGCRRTAGDPPGAREWRSGDTASTRETRGAPVRPFVGGRDRRLDTPGCDTPAGAAGGGPRAGVERADGRARRRRVRARVARRRHRGSGGGSAPVNTA